MKINNFTQIEAWIEARQLVKQIYQLSNNNFKHDYGLKDQIQRASVSIASNHMQSLFTDY